MDHGEPIDGSLVTEFTQKPDVALRTTETLDCLPIEHQCDKRTTVVSF